MNNRTEKEAHELANLISSKNAFPFIFKVTYGVNGKDEGYVEAIRSGLTKREYFAGLAMQGLLSDIRNRETRENLALSDKMIAEYAVIMADNLLEELLKEK